MDVSAFQRRLRESGGYDTDPAARRGLDRLLGRFDAWYYTHVMAIVWSGYRAAVRGRFDNAVFAHCSLRTLRAVEACGGRVSIRGCGRMAALEGGRVYVANHMSMVETMILPCLALAFSDFAPVVKESLLRYPLFGAILRAVRPVSVSRRDPRADLREVMETGMAMLKNGRSVLLFPQATRSPVFDPAAFNTLGAKLAARAGVPLVPVALKTDFVGIGRRLRDFGPLDRRQPMRYEFGPPLAAEGNGREAHQKAVAFLTATLSGWGVSVQRGASGGDAAEA